MCAVALLLVGAQSNGCKAMAAPSLGTVQYGQLEGRLVGRAGDATQLNPCDGQSGPRVKARTRTAVAPTALFCLRRIVVPFGLCYNDVFQALQALQAPRRSSFQDHKAQLGTGLRNRLLVLPVTCAVSWCRVVKPYQRRRRAGRERGKNRRPVPSRDLSGAKPSLAGRGSEA
ncbi:uncharacterized protein P884DRAFT_31308 [Thermothelomyces heterothallicus CBS 202.75]|uniref:uncharacterized protein n=1 Tax=Thermothelomyces heterothallicus CBS 202.75 TaxID=1149848 RepID=UPI0037435F34